MKNLFVLGLAVIGVWSTDALAIDNPSFKFSAAHLNTNNLSSLNILEPTIQKDYVALQFVQNRRNDDRYDSSMDGDRSSLHHKEPPPPHHPHHDAPPPPPQHHPHHDAPPPPPQHHPHHDAPPPHPRGK